jgi:Mn2+/Fe2+ NRAMP family transporter
MTTPAPSPAAAPAIDALQKVLAAHHQAVFAYSVVGVELQDAGQVAHARTFQQAHRDARDVAAGQLAALGATPVPAAASYQPSEKVTDASTAQRWALEIEQDGAAAYRFQLLRTAASDSATQTCRSALAGLRSGAENALYWRALLTPATPTVPFPGS